MNRGQIGGAVAIVIGCVLIYVGIQNLGRGSGDDAQSVVAPTTTTTTAPLAVATPVVPATTTPPPPAPTTTITPPPTTVAPTTVAPTTVPPTTTNTVAPTTTTAGDQLVADFIEVFATALEAGDSTFVFSRLHPAIVEAFDEELCSNWVDAEIMQLGNYMLTGAVTGPMSGSLDTPSGSVAFANSYTADISFDFGGETFETTANYVLIDGEVYFTGTCR